MQPAESILPLHDNDCSAVPRLARQMRETPQILPRRGLITTI
jgi:hypothetical protein